MAYLGLDLDKAAGVLRAESVGDWFQDPWGWPEFSQDFIKTVGVEDLGVVKSGTKFQFDGSPNFHSFDVPKSFLGTRPAVVQDPLSRLAYTAASLGLAPELHAKLPDWVFGWRMREGEYPIAGSMEWEKYKESQSGIQNSSYAGQTDVTSFFASIDIDVLLRRIKEICGQNVLIEIVETILRTHNNLNGRGGLPQRSYASSILAQVALQAIDDLIQMKLDSGSIVAARRWMDDISFEGPESDLYWLLLEVQDYCRRAGLEVNLGKTKLISGRESSELLRVEAQGLIRLPISTTVVSVDYGDAEYTFIDSRVLNEAEEEVLTNPRGTSRSRARMVLKSLARWERFGRIDEWKLSADNLPHAADSLGQYFLAAQNSEALHFGLSTWFVDLSNGPFSRRGWVVSQFGQAVSAEAATDDALDVFRSWLETSEDLNEIAVAASRLSNARPSEFRVLFSQRVDRIQDPNILRVFALGHLQADGPIGQVQTVLSRHPSNKLILKFLEVSNWRVPSMKPLLNREFIKPIDDGIDWGTPSS